MKLFQTILCALGVAFAAFAQSPLPLAATKSVTVTPAGLLTGNPSTNLFLLNTNLLHRAAAFPVNAASNALVAAIGATNATRQGEINSLSNGVYGALTTASASRVGEINALSNSLGSSVNGLSNGVYSAIASGNAARVSDINGSSNTLSASISSLSSSVSSSISSAISSATSTITSAYTAAVNAAKYQINILVATRSVNSVADLIAMRTDSLPGATNGLTVMVRGYYDREGDGGGMFHLAPTYSLPADITGTNRGTCFATVDATNMVWIRRDRGNLTVRDFGAFCSQYADDHAVVQDAINSTTEITFPSGTTTKLGSGGGNAIDVPDGRQIHIKGTITGPDNFRFNGSVVVDGGGTVSLTGGTEPRKFRFFAGNCVVRDISFVGAGGEYAVLVDKSASMASITVDRCRFENVWTGILREAWPMSTPNPIYQCKRAVICNNTFTNINCIGGDWEPNLNDGSVDVIGNRFQYIHFLYNNNGFGGFAFAFAGWTADHFGNEALQLHRLTFRDNVVDRCQEGLHVEYCTDVDASNNHFGEIAEGFVSFSTNVTVIPFTMTSAMTFWGCQRVIASHNTFSSVTGTNSHYAIRCNFAWGDSPQDSPDRVQILNNVAAQGDIELAMMAKVTTNFPAGVVAPIGTVNGNVCHNGGIHIYGRGQLTAMNNFARAPWGQTAFLFDAAESYAPYFEQLTRIPIVLKNNTGVTPIGSPSYSITNLDETDTHSNLTIEAVGNNFPVLSASQTAMNGGTVYWSTNGVPYGHTFQTGDIIVDTSARPPRTILVTQGGSRTVPGDYCNAQPSTNAAKGWVSAAVHPWYNGGYHQAGQLVQITGVPGTVTGMIGEIFLDPEHTVVAARIIDPATGAPLNLTGFTPSLMKALNEVVTTTEGALASAWDPPSVAAGGLAQLTNLYVPGALPGDQVLTSFSLDTSGLVLQGNVTTNDYCRVVLYNPTTNTINLATGTLRVSTRTP